jgi:putative DNA primase/helicase
MINRAKYIKYYIRGGIKIFPCISDGKSPLITGWQEKASSSKEVVAAWWDKYPNANIGLLTGKKANLVVVDVDVKKGARGMESLKQLQDECGKLDTRMVHTPSGGLHYYFSYPQGVDTLKNRANLMPGIDIRADGGLVIAPGSSIDGNRYEFEDIDKEIAELPQKLLDILTDDSHTHKEYEVVASEVINGVEQGNRNNSIFRLASKLRGDDIPRDIAASQIVLAAQNCTPPLSKAEALRCFESAYTRYEPNNNVELSEQHLTELGSAKELINSYGLDIRFIPQFGKWLLWDGYRWCFDETGHISRLAKANALSQYEKVAQLDDFNQRREMSRYATKSESRQAIESTIHLAKTEEGMPLKVEQLDTNQYFLGVANGVINLKSGEMLDDTKNDYLTKQAPVVFSRDAKCPRWLEFLNQAMSGDQEMIGYLQRIVGYSLTGDTKEQVLFFLYGHGANGKSKFIGAIQDMLGDYAMQTPVSTLMTRGKGSINNDVARMRGARFVATTETEEGSKFNESEIKLLTGGDTITCRFLRQEYFEYRPEFKIWISGNHKPVPGDGHGIWRRLILIPFEVIVDDADQDKELHLKLRKELSGILNWAIEGCLQWQEVGLQTPQKILDAVAEYKSEMDRVHSWMEECCESKPRAGSETKASDLYHSYKYWAHENGEWAMSQRIFGNKLGEKGYKKVRKGQGQFYLGISLTLSCSKF